MATNRDHFNDNIVDITSLNDIINEKSINILSKKEEILFFEFGNDFFKYDSNERMLIQFPDFVSMRDNKNSVDCTTEDYGEVIIDSIDKNEDINYLKDFDLFDRDNYIKENLTNKKDYFSIPVDIARNIENKKRPLKDLAGKQKEMQDINSMFNAVVETIALMFIFYKHITIKAKKDQIIDQAVMRKSQNEMNSLLKDRELLREVPEIKNVVEKASKFYYQIDVKQSSNDVSKRKELPDFIPLAKEMTNFALKDKDIMDTCEKISESEVIRKKLKKAESTINGFMNDLENAMPALNEELSSNKDKYLKLLNKIHQPTVFGSGATPEEREKSFKFVDFWKKSLELGTDKKDYLEFLVANNYISKQLYGESRNTYEQSIFKYISHAKDLDNLEYSKIKGTVEKIVNSLLELNISEEQNKKLKI